MVVSVGCVRVWLQAYLIIRPPLMISWLKQPPRRTLPSGVSCWPYSGSRQNLINGVCVCVCLSLPLCVCASFSPGRLRPRTGKQPLVSPCLSGLCFAKLAALLHPWLLNCDFKKATLRPPPSPPFFPWPSHGPEADTDFSTVLANQLFACLANEKPGADFDFFFSLIRY